MAVSFVNTQQPRIDAWIQPGCRADIAVVSTESWPVDTVVTIGVANAAGVIAVPLLTITPDLATVTATVALTGVQVAALAVACPPPYGVIDWQWRTGAGSPLGVGSLHWDLTGSAQSTTAVATVIVGPQGPTAVSADVGNAAELGTDGLLFVSPTAGRYSVDVPSGSATAAITHGLGTLDVLVMVREISGGAFVEPDIAVTSATVVTLTFATAPTAGQYRVTVLA